MPRALGGKLLDPMSDNVLRIEQNEGEPAPASSRTGRAARVGPG
jgi:hypothetical protein